MNRLQLCLMDAMMLMRTATRALTSDPLLFALQVARRLRLRGEPQDGVDSLTNAYRWYLADHHDRAGRMLVSIGQPRKGLRKQLWRRLAIQLGLVRASDDDPAQLRWLDRHQVGDLTGAAAAVAPASLAGRRARSELRALTPAGAPSRADRSSSGRPQFLLTNSLPYTRSGYTHRSHAILTALTAAGVHPHAVTRLAYPTTVGLPFRPRRAVVDRLTYERLASGRLPVELDARLDLQARLLAECARREGAGVLHTTTDWTNGYSVRAAADSLGLPWVYEMRGQLEQTWVSSRPPALRDEAASSERVRLLRAKETELASQANAVIVLSDVQRKDLIARGVPASQIHVVPNSVDPRYFGATDSPETARARLRLPAEGIWVGSISSLVDYEGFDVLLRAVAALRADGMNVRCALVGDGASRPSLMALADALGLGEAALFPGNVSPVQARTWHQALDVFVVPRRDSTVTRMITPLKPLEAMASSRPVVASDLPALAEIIEAPGAGLLFRPGDVDALAETLQTLCADHDLRRALGASGHSFASARTWQNAAGIIVDIYRKECGVEVR